MSSWPFSIGLVAASFLLGSIPFGVIVGRLRGVDVRKEGSGNIGATNVARTVGKGLGVLVLLMDALKGALPLLVPRFWPEVLASSPLGAYLPVALGVAAVLGHCFPPWLRFRGGKGVATALGVLLVTDPLATAIAFAVFALVYGVWRYVSLGSLVAALAFPLVLWLLGRGLPAVVLAVAVALIVLSRHGDNLRRLRGGKEHRM
jgi:glycerol-3-phosphate acyltransferase PlsY